MVLDHVLATGMFSTNAAFAVIALALAEECLQAVCLRNSPKCSCCTY